MLKTVPALSPSSLVGEPTALLIWLPQKHLALIHGLETSVLVVCGFAAEGYGYKEK